MTDATPSVPVDAIRRYLAGLKQDNPRLFLRVCDAAHGDRKPMDSDGELRNRRHIVLTDEGGLWLEGYAEAIVAMTERDEVDDAVYHIREESAGTTLAEAA